MNLSDVYGFVRGLPMIRIDGNFLYQLGYELHQLVELDSNALQGNVLVSLWTIESWLDALLNRSVYRLQTSRLSGTALLATVREVKGTLEGAIGKEEEFSKQIGSYDHYRLTSQAKTFETVLSAELQTSQLYLVQPKGGLDLNQLTDNGLAMFPSALAIKVPEAISDALEAARCVAFELPTAAAFHLHRLHELVLRRYYDAVTDGKPRPENRNIGAYIDALKNSKFKDQKVFGALAGLKNFHRNPVLHPDDRLENIEEALALLGSIYTVISYMLSALPDQPLQLTPPPSDEKKAIEDKSDKASDKAD